MDDCRERERSLGIFVILPDFFLSELKFKFANFIGLKTFFFCVFIFQNGENRDDFK
jgi:hypothetical protein